MNTQRTPGFTIVELLIVVVVIAILAAITIISYNGIQNRAKESSAQSAASQASKRVAQHYVVNSDTFPANQAAFDALNIASGETTFQYVANNSANPKTYCLTATFKDVSYYINNTNATKPTKGGCPGHGQGGVAAITNVALNPRATNLYAIYTNNGTSHPLVKPVTVTATPDGITTAAEQRIATGQVTTSVLSVYNLDGLNNTAGFSRSISAWVRVNAAGYELKTNTAFTAIDIPPNQWVRVETTNTFGPTEHSGLIIAKKTGNVSETDRAWITGVMAVQGTINYPFRDGNSPDWVWNGTSGISASTGPSP